MIAEGLHPCVLASRILGGYALKGGMPWLPLDRNMDDFAFDAQMLAEILWAGVTIGEVSCPTVYFPEASSINFVRSCQYGFGCLGIALKFRLAKWRLLRSRKFSHR